MSMFETKEDSTSPASRHSLSDVIKSCKKKVFTLRHTMKIAEALKALADRRFLSAPLILKPDKEKFKEEGPIPGYCGIVHAGSILESVLRRISQIKDLKKPPYEKGSQGKAKIDNTEQMIQEISNRWEKFTAAGKDFGKENIIALTDLSDVCEGVTSAHLGWDLRKFIQRMFVNTEGKNVHRAILFNKDGEIENYITQSDILRYVYTHLEDWKELNHKTIEELDLVPKKKHVITVIQETPTIEAYQLMYKNRISCIGVTNKKGRLIGSLSNADLRGLDTEEFALLDASVGLFLNFGHAEWREKNQDLLNISLVKSRTQTTKKSSEFGYLVSLMAEARAHAVYIVDDDDKPIGIITLTDVLGILSR
eukprot:jgi/Bigna1/86060/estExt_fgenesh1_pg.C_70360